MKSLVILCATTAVVAQNQIAQMQTMPAQLVGTWSYTETNATQFRDRATGSFARPSGSSSTFEFHADGTFKNWDLIQQSMYNCTETVYIVFTGHAVFDGPAIRLHYDGGHVSSKDNCNARFNYEKPAKPEIRDYDSWTIRHTPNGPQLLISAGGRVRLIYTRMKTS